MAARGTNYRRRGYARVGDVVAEMDLREEMDRMRDKVCDEILTLLYAELLSCTGIGNIGLMVAIDVVTKYRKTYGNAEGELQ